MKKLLLISQKYSIFTKPLMKAFSDLGIEVVYADYLNRPVLMPYTAPHKLVSKLPHLLKEKIIARELKKVDRQIIEKARSFSPDYILVSKGKNISPEVLGELRKIGITMNWYSETMDHWPTISKIAPNYDLFFNFDPVVVQKLNEQGYDSVRYLPFCADIDKNSKYPEGERIFNISFVGSFDPERYAFRENILSEVKESGINIWGNKSWLKTSLARFYHGYPPYEELMEINRQSVVGISMHLNDVEGTGVNVRPFEVSGGGAFLLCHDVRKDIFNLFEEGEEFISFHGPEDIKEKVKFYLEHKEERERIAKAGFERTRDEHTYIDRAKEILNQADGK